MSAVSLEGVGKRFGEFRAVSDLSFEVPNGIVYGILGPNGAGKSTTLRMLTDIIAADEGAIRLLDRFAPGRDAAMHMGYLPEERGLYPKMRVLDTLAFFGELRGISRRRARELGVSWLERLGLSDWAGKRVNELSKGMQQKVQFATTFLHEPELVILDEPWSGLDPINAEVLKSIVMEQKAAGTTILFSTHLMEQAEQICDRVCIIAAGKRVAEGTVTELRRSGGQGLVFLEMEGAGDREKLLSEVLSNSELVAGHREGDGGFTVELADGVEPGDLLRRVLDVGLELRRYHRVESSLQQVFVERVGNASVPRNPEEAS